MRTFEEFWWASAMSRMDTRDAQTHVYARGTTGLRTSVPPEEVTTFNLVRRLAGRRRLSGGLALALHSRPLEGGNRTTGRPPSGADLELAVELAPGRWWDAVLQAKRFSPAHGSYRGWKTSQTANLITWAAVHGRTRAGMLLYNSPDAPFPGQRGATALFRGCCSPVRRHDWKWPNWNRPNGNSPLAVSLVPDVSKLTVKNLVDPTPSRVSPEAMPLECIFCPAAHRGANCRLPTTGMPRWAKELQRDAANRSMVEPHLGDQINDEPSSLSDLLELEESADDVASYSLVLGMSEYEREVYDALDEP